jgi:two-component system, sensor histidine kinase and response regulator
MQSFELKSAIESVISGFASKAGVRQLDLLYIFDKDVPRSIFCNEGYLKELLHNTLSLFIRNRFNTEVLIEISARLKKGDAYILAFTFKHCSTPEGYHKIHLSGQSYDPRLIASRHLLHLLDGELHQNIENGQCETFVITIPVIEARLSSPIENLNGPIKRDPVLLITESQFMICSIREIMERNGLTLFVTDCENSISVLKEYRFSAVILNNSYHNTLTSLQMKRIAERSWAVKPIYLSWITDPQVTTSEFGNVVFLAKPFTEESLLRKIMNSAETRDLGIENLFARKYPLDILVADENTTTLLMVEDSLSSLGYDATLVSTIEEAMERSSKKRFDMIFLDFGMQTVKDQAIIQKIKGSNQDSVMIEMASCNAEENHFESLKSPFEETIAKPVFKKDIIRLITKWCSNQNVNTIL